MTPRRAWTAAVALAVALLAIAVAVGTLLEPRTRDFDRFVRLRIWKIDVHEQIDPEVLSFAVNVASSQGILGIVNLGGDHAGGGLERHLEAAARFPGRVLVFMELDERDCCDAAWVERETARLVEGRALGARGLHVPASIPLDSGALDPIWQVALGLRIPIAFHPGPGPEAVDRMVRLVERNPGISFLALEMAGMGGDPAALGALLARLPNLHVDTGSSIPKLARDPEATRTLLTTHADRVLLGTDLVWMQGPRPEQRALAIGHGPPVRSREALTRAFDSTWRFLETRDEDIPGPVAGDGPVNGIGLPRDALQLIYQGNARRLLGFGDLEAQ